MRCWTIRGRVTRAAGMLATAVALAAGCMTAGNQVPASTVPATSSATTARTYPGLFPQYRNTFRPNNSDLGGRSNADLAALLPTAADFPQPGRTDAPNIAAEDGSGLGLHGQTDGETRAPQCLYTPFGKSFSQAPDGSDWNLYYVASTFHESDPPGDHIVVTINREREKADVFALTDEWIKNCGQYDRAFPTFAAPDVRNRHVRDTFASGPAVDGVQTYVYTTTSTDLADASADKPAAPPQGKRILLARVRAIVLEVEGTEQTNGQVLDQLMAKAITNAQHAPTPEQNAERLAGLTDCSSVPIRPGDAAVDPALDCAVRTTDGTGVVFEVIGQPAGTIRVFDSEGSQQQVIAEPNAVLSKRLPFAQDVDMDKRQELLVVTATGGMGGDTMNIWRGRPHTDQFDLSGTLTGFARFWLTTDRFVGINTQSTPLAGVVTIFRFVDNKLELLALLDTEARTDQGPLDPHWRLNGNVKCALNTSDDPPGAFNARGDALRAAGVDPATAEEHFCLQPWVAGLYRQR